MGDYGRDYVTLMEALATAQGERRLRQGWNGGELGWVTYEREVMHREVNRLREGRGLPAVGLTAIRNAEQQAVGHSDYTKKFALACERLTAAEPPPAGGEVGEREGGEHG